MKRFSLNLPSRHRLDISLVKRHRSDTDKSIIANIQKINQIKKGSKISRFFRYIFEGKKIKSVLGANLAIITLGSSLLPKHSEMMPATAQESLTLPIILVTKKSSLRYPVDKIIITQGYKFYHPGIDFDGATGDPVYAVLDGKVEAIQFSRYGYGDAIYISHEGSYSSLYAHLSEISVTKNQFVTQGAEIGKIGATGSASGDHLHFEIRENGVPINPLSILP